MLKNILLVVLIFYSFLTTAQSANVLSFEKLTHDFGTINEEVGSVSHSFTFKNMTDDTLKITNVQASCGCTTPAWTKEVIAPGDSGFVKAKYSTINRPGYFNKTITVNTNLKSAEAILSIKGNVVPKAKSPEEVLTAEFGALRTKYRVFNMGKIFTDGNPAVKSFEVYNAGNDNVIFKKALKPDHINIELPDTLSPKSIGSIDITYDVKKKNDLGFFSENIVIITNEPSDSVKSFTLFTNIEEYFPPMSKEEFERTPRISIGEQVYDFDRVESGEKVKATFELLNNGLSTLNIRKLETNCSCLTAELAKNDLSPGESTVINVIFDTVDRRGNQQKAVTIYSNDPTSPVQRLTVKGYVSSE